MAAGGTPASNALPTGGKVVAGSATISSNSTPQSAVMNVNQTSQRAIVNWSTFNVGSNATVNFNQPNAQAVILNRVTSGSASVINGAINANGQVILVNSSGVTFGKGSQVNAPGVVASTLDLANKDFMAGRNTYVGDGNGKIINEGTIKSTAIAGYIALLAPEVQNQGLLIAQKDSTIAIGSGKQITLSFQGNSLISLKVDQGIYNGLIENKRAIEAPGGLVILAAADANQLMSSVINNAGTISASGVIDKGGIIEIVAANVSQSGSISANATGSAGQGGQVNLVGKNISLESNSITSATGISGGGQINIGLSNTQVSGGSQINSSSPSTLSATQAQALSASNANLANQNNTMAETVSIQAGAVVNTSAIQTGNGGMIAIWSQIKTTVAGILQSMGGALSGNGGFIETSSRGVVNLTSSAQMNTSAPNGKAGTWLLDPIDLLIDANGANVIGMALANNNVIIDVTNSAVCSLGVGVCAPSLGGGNLTLGADIIKMGQNLTTLTLSASGIFNLNANIIGQNLDVVIRSSIAYLNVGTRIEATTVKVEAVNSITTSGVIQTVYQYLGSSTTMLGNLLELLAQSIYVNGGLLVSTTSSRAGTLNLTANQITLNPSATLFASGQSGGNITIRSSGTFDDSASIKANGVALGGTISISSGLQSNYSGASIEAIGSQGGGAISLITNSGDLNLGASNVFAQGLSGSGGVIAINGQNGVNLNASSISVDGVASGGSISIQSSAGGVRLTSTLVQANSANSDRGNLGGVVNFSAYANQITLTDSDVLAHGYTGTGTIGIGGVSTHDVLTHDQVSGIDPWSIVDASQYVVGRAPQVASAISKLPSAMPNLFMQQLQSLFGPLNSQRLPEPQGMNLARSSQGPRPNDFATMPHNDLVAQLFGGPLPGSPAPGESGRLPGVAGNNVPGSASGVGPNSPPQGVPPKTGLASGNPPPGTASVAGNNQPPGSRAPGSNTPPPPPPSGSNSRGPDSANVQGGPKTPPPPPAKPPYEGKYANGLPSARDQGNKAAPPPAAYQGKYADRVQALNGGPPRLNANAANDPFHAMLGLPAQANAPLVGPVPFPSSASDALSASYDSLPSIRNSAMNHVGQSHLSNAYKESLESHNLTTTMTLLIGL